MKKTKKLSLNKETIRELAQTELKKVMGGYGIVAASIQCFTRAHG